MKSNNEFLYNLIVALAVAMAFGAIAWGALYFVAEWTFVQAVMVGLIAVLVAAVFLVLAFLRPLPAPGSAVISPPVVSHERPARVMAAPVATPAPVVAAVHAVTAAPVAVVAPLIAKVPASAADGRPPMLAEPRAGQADDLKIVRGIGPKLEQMLHGMGIFHFDQIAGWGAAELAWVDDNLEGFKGRASRDAWVPQAKVLAAGGSEAEAFAAADAVRV